MDIAKEHRQPTHAASDGAKLVVFLRGLAFICEKKVILIDVWFFQR